MAKKESEKKIGFWGWALIIFILFVFFGYSDNSEEIDNLEREVRELQNDLSSCKSEKSDLQYDWTCGYNSEPFCIVRNSECWNLCVGN